MDSRDRTSSAVIPSVPERSPRVSSESSVDGAAAAGRPSESDLLRRSIDDLHERIAEIRSAEARLQTEIGRFYVSASQLGSSIARGPIVQAIREILADLVGSEEVVIVSVVTPTQDGSPAILHAWTGETCWRDWGEVGRWAVEDVVRTGHSFYRATEAEVDAEPSAGGSDLSACIALRAGTRVVGAVAIFGLLPQKEELNGFDRDLCEMVGSLGGQALYCSELHESLEGRAGSIPG